MASERRHAPPAPVADVQVLLIFEAGGRRPQCAPRAGGRRCRGWGSVVVLLARALCSRCPGTAPNKKGWSPRGEGVGCVRASAALFSHLSTFCKGGICEGRCEAPARAPDALGRRAVVRRRSPHARGAAHKTAAKGGTRQSCPPPPIPNLGRWDSRGGARRARGPGALGGRAGGAGGDARLPLRETRRVQGLRNGSSAKASVAALGAAHGADRPPTPRPREGTRRSLVAAPAVAQYPGGGRYKLLLADRERPRSGEAGVDVSSLPSALPTHC